VIRVDPRACGGARVEVGRGRPAAGRSPRVRGSPRYGEGERVGAGSIPARAGEPPSFCPCPSSSGVDPRACGGAAPLGCASGSVRGRSPRVRGSLGGGHLGDVAPGSIPARAGEPQPQIRSGAGGGVDPRACGGARSLLHPAGRPEGRSPRVRGSPGPSGVAERNRGSIPARAGEPLSAAAPGAGSGVDPRACGGAHSRNTVRNAVTGRSPRVRGSLKDARDRDMNRGSIPARAGEPVEAGDPGGGCGVDPRACGGALRAYRPRW